MCTVTILPFDGGVRVVCNRDERCTRLEAMPPAAHPTSAGAATYPVDPQSGGTWIGVNDSGLVAALLNRTRDRARHSRTRPISRGLIVPALLACPSLDAALETAAALDGRRFEPFTVVLLDRSHGLTLTHGGRTPCAMTVFDVTAPAMFTSSSLGDHIVEPPRRRLFEQLVVGDRNRLAGQFRFHRHRWTDAPRISVCMERADAVTVSRTTIDLRDGFTRVVYEPLFAPHSSATKTA